RPDGRKVEADRRDALSADLPGVLQGEGPEASRSRPRVRRDRGRRGRRDRRRERTRDGPGGDQEGPGGTRRGPESLRMLPRITTIRERDAHGIRTGEGPSD